MKELISIIVPVYNVPEQYLNKCLESLINQTYTDIEIIVVDDGSTDQSPAICDSFQSKDSRIKVIHKKNAGLSAARNTGYYSATGHWLMFVDGDDWIESDMCEKMISLAEEKNVQIVMCGMSKDYERTSVNYKYYLESHKVYTDNECRWLQEQLLHFNGNLSTAYCKLISIELLKKYDITHNDVLKQGAEGIEFNLRLFEHINSAIFIDEPFYHYIFNENSISAKHDENNHRFVLNCFNAINDFIQISENKENLEFWLYNRMLYVVITTAISGYFSPVNHESFCIAREKFLGYLSNPLVNRAMQINNNIGLSLSRKITIWLIKNKMFFGVKAISYLRWAQRKVK